MPFSHAAIGLHHLLCGGPRIFETLHNALMFTAELFLTLKGQPLAVVGHKVG